MQLELRAMPPFFGPPFSLGLMDLALLPSRVLFLSISFMACAWKRTGKALPYLLNLTHALMCALKASSFSPPFFSNSSFTASPHNPHTHFPLNFSRTRSMYSGVHSSDIPQHSHLAFSTSDIGVSFRPSISSLVSSKEMSETVRWRFSDASFGGFDMLLFLEKELAKDSPWGAIMDRERRKDISEV